MALTVLITYLAVLVLTLVWATRSGAAEAGQSQSTMAHRLTTAAPESCTARKAVRYYRAALNQWLAKMGAGQQYRGSLAKGTLCPLYLARVLQRKAHAARLAYRAWWNYHWNWPRWLPDKWQRIGACETGYGHRPGNWRHSNSSYEGAFGFALSSWDAFVPRADPKAGPYPANAYLATPRQQYEVALAIWRMYGLSGWGCRGA